MNIPARPLLRCVLAAALLPSSALAGGTQINRLSSFEDFSKGESKNAIISPQGQVLVGYADSSTTLEDSELVLRCAAKGSKIYAGTGQPAAVYEVQAHKGKPRFRKLAQLPGVSVTSVVKDSQGRILAAVLPGAKIYQIIPGKKPKIFAELLAGRIWDLQMHKGTLYAATGPEGRVFSISRKGKSKLALDTEAVDVMTLLSMKDALLAGTANNAAVYRVGSKPEGELLEAFEGNEVRALRQEGRYLYAVVNEFSSPGLSELNKMVQKVAEASVTGSEQTRTRLENESAKSSGKVYRMSLHKGKSSSAMAESVWESLFEKEGQYFTDLTPVEGGRSAIVTSSGEGKVYRIRGFQSPSLVADFEEQQASAVCKAPSGAIMAFSAGPAAAHRLVFAQANQASYVTEPLDADYPAQYGQLRLRGQGALKVQTRSGPSERIDARWTPFRSVSLKKDGIFRVGQIAAKRMRFLQVKVSLASPTDRLDALEVFYRAHNLAPHMGEITVGGPKFEPESDSEPPSSLEVKWESQARDGDELVYELALRPVRKGSGWKALNRGETVSEESYELPTSNLPDGIYELSVTASDELANGSRDAKRDRRVSDPFLVDKSRPKVLSVQRKGKRVSGKVSDKLSRIHDVAYRIDQGSYRAASATDGIFDEHEEGFEIELPDTLHESSRIMIRVRDEQGNRHTRAID